MPKVLKSTDALALDCDAMMPLKREGEGKSEENLDVIYF